jgi:hypothetical protein
MLIVLALGSAVSLSAHKVTPDPTVQFFVRPAGDRVSVKVWLPVVALADANLPRTSDGHFIAGEIRGALELVARGIARDLELQQGAEPLGSPTVVTTLSPDESFVAIDLDFPSQSGTGDLSARFHPFRAYGQIIATEVRYIVDDNTARTVVVDGQAQRISFTPGVVQVAQQFVNEAGAALFDGTDLLLWAVCLVAVAGAARRIAVAVVSLLAGHVLVVALVVSGLLTLSTSASMVMAALAASTVVMLAIQTFGAPASRWLPLLGFAFGAFSGAATGNRLLHEWGFAGDHGGVAFLAFVLTLSAGQLWLVALLASAAGLVRRRGRAAELAVLSTAIFAGHAAIHRVVDQGQALADAGTYSLDRFLFTLTTGWAALILCAGIISAVLPSRLATRAGAPIEET